MGYNIVQLNCMDGVVVLNYLEEFEATSKELVGIILEIKLAIR